MDRNAGFLHRQRGPLPDSQSRTFYFFIVPVVLNLVLDVWQEQLLQLRQGSSDVFLSVKSTL